MSWDVLILIGLEILNSITILTLLAFGLAVIFGMMRIVNLAQGEFFTIGAFTVLAATQFAGLRLWAAMPRVRRWTEHYAEVRDVLEEISRQYVQQLERRAE